MSSTLARVGNRYIRWSVGWGLLMIMFLFAVEAQEKEDWVDVQKLEPSIYLEMPYATPNNFLKEAVYPKAVCLLHRPVALALQQAQQTLLKQGYSLKLWDCYRPLSVQKKMFALVPNPDYVADPKDGSRHNRGAAVDVTLVKKDGQALEVPTAFDDFSPKASPANITQWSPKARLHYFLLQGAMTKVGFTVLNSEWWHYDYNGWKQYPVSDFSFP